MPRGPIPKDPERKARPKRSTMPRIEPVDGVPAPPGTLGPHGSDAWNRFWHSATWLVESDATVLLLLCEGLDRLREMEAVVEREGRSVAGSKGQPVAHALLVPIDRLRDQLFAWMQECGFTPAARRRLGLPVATRAQPSYRDEQREDPYAHLRIAADRESSKLDKYLDPRLRLAAEA